MYTMMENQSDQQPGHPANGFTTPLDLEKPFLGGDSQGSLSNDAPLPLDEPHQAPSVPSESPHHNELPAEVPNPEASGEIKTENEQSGSSEAPAAENSANFVTVPPQQNMTVEEFLTELVHAYPQLDLTCLTSKDITVMMRHSMRLDKERFGLVPLAEYEATRRPKPAPRPMTNYNNPYQNVKNSMAHQQMAYANMQQQGYGAQQSSSAQPQMNAAASQAGANPYANIDPAVLSNWYNEMLKTGYPQEQLQAYFSDMLMKMTQGQAAMQQQQQQQQQSQQQPSWASTSANSYAGTTSANAYAAASTSAAGQMAQAATYSSQASSSYNHKSASSPYAAAATTAPSGDASAYDAQKLAALQQYANYQGSAAAAAAAAAMAQQQQSAAGSGYPQAALDMSTWPQQAGGGGDLSGLQGYGGQEDQAGQQHPGYM